MIAFFHSIIFRTAARNAKALAPRPLFVLVLP
jgi:hypothetical protein